MDYQNLTAPCGIPCFECAAYKAQFNENIQKMISTNLGIDYEHAACTGCRNKSGIGYLSVQNNIFPDSKCSLLNADSKCKIYLCVESKNIHNCSECSNFPCDKLQPCADREPIKSPIILKFII